MTADRDRVRLETAADPLIWDVGRWRRVSPNGFEPNTGSPEREDAIDPEQIAACRLWLRTFAVPVATIRRRHSSYGLKHMVEDWTRPGPYLQKDAWSRTWSGPYLYIANGAFIEAAILEGYRAVRCDVGSMSAYFSLRVRTTRGRGAR